MVHSNPASPDSDGDGLDDKFEMDHYLDPENNDTDGDGAKDGNEYYTRTFEYSYRVYINGGKRIGMTFKEDHYSLGLKEANLLVGIRAVEGKTIQADVYVVTLTGDKKLGHIETGEVVYESYDVEHYAKKSDVQIYLRISGNGWLETFKVVLVESSDPHKWDTDGDGLSDGYEINGESGYITSPVSKDTDSDGLRDDWEIRGWSWNYGEKSKYRNNNGFHTNPCSPDTDGDGFRDSVDANPLGNVLVKVTINNYHWENTEKFAGIYIKWTYGGESRSVKYFTARRTGDIGGWSYYFDVPDSINTVVEIKVSGFYHDWQGDHEDTNLAYQKTSRINNGLIFSEGSSDGDIHLTVTARFVTLSRVHTVAVYNESVWKSGHYLYSGKYYVLYVKATDGSGVINKGLNVILVPEAIFVNSELYSKIKSNKISYLVGSDSSVAKMGAITTKDMGVHVVGMFFFKASASQVKELLSLLTRNVTGKRFARYAVITAERANLPDDVLRAIPVGGVKNSPVGSGPQSLWQEIVSTFVNLAITAAGFLYSGLIATANFIAHAAQVVAEFYMKLWNTVVNAVRAAVEEVKKVVDAAVEWLKQEVEEAVNKLIESIKESIDGNKIGNLVRQTALDIEGSNGNATAEKVGIDIIKIMEYLIGISSIVLAGIGIFAAAELLWYTASEGIGAVVSEIVAGMLKNVVLSILLTGVPVETMNVVSEKTGHGIDNPVVLALLKMFSLSAEFAGMIWDLYKVLVEKAEKGRVYFYIGLAVAIGAFIASTAGETFEISDNLLKAYDAIVCGISITGLGLMYADREHDIGNVLPLTSLLEWSVGWAGVISAFVKLSADAASGFRR